MSPVEGFLPWGSVTFVDAQGRPRIEVEIARQPVEQALGLMFRKWMAPDHGMLFSWPRDEVRRFWMRNTYLPLDVMFIGGDNRITRIFENVPALSDALWISPGPARHVLEVNAGFCRHHGVSVGQGVVIEG